MPALALTLPTDGGRTTKALYSAFLKSIAAGLFRLPETSFPERLRPLASGLRAHLRSLGKDVVFDLLRRPQVHAFLRCALTATDPDEGREMAGKLLFQTLFEMAADGTLPDGERAWPSAPPLPRLASQTHGVLQGVDEAETLAFANGRVIVDGADRAITADPEAFHAVEPGLRFALADPNPVSEFSDHPEVEGNAVTLGDADVATWLQGLRDCLRVIEDFTPGIRAEMRLVLQQLIPVGTASEHHASCSYKDAIGSIYLTLNHRLLTMAEALIHEFQHNKLYLLFHADPVMKNADWPLFASPLRPDPRPLRGHLLGAHAFVPIAELYRRIEQSGSELRHLGGFRERFGQVIEKNGAALATLMEHAVASARGQELIDDLVERHSEHERYFRS